MEERIVEKKKKKNSWDSVLPRSGLNPGFLPDKGQAGVSSFNHMNAADFAGGEACCEELEDWLILDEASKTRSDYIITRMCFAGRRLDDLAKGVDNSISLSNIIDTKNGPAIYDPAHLKPSTVQLMSRLDDHPGSGDKSAELLSKIVHHVFLVTTKGVPGTIIKYISSQDHARLHNFVTATLSKLLAVYGKDEISKYKEAYTTNLLNKTIDGYARSLCLDAWIVRELYSKYIDPKSTTALYDKHQIELGKESGKFFIDHPEYVTDDSSTILKIKTPDGDRHVQLIISTINNTQIKNLETDIINGYIKSFPEYLESDFIGYIDLDNNSSSKSFSDFKNLFNNKLEEDLNELNLLSKSDIRNYLENNIDKEPIINDIIKQLTDKYLGELTPEAKTALLGTAYLSDTDKIKRIWTSQKAKKLKQLIIAQYVRYFLSQGNYSNVEIWSKVIPFLDDSDLKYKLKPEDIAIKYNDIPGEYEVDLPRTSPVSIEDIYNAIAQKKIIRIDVKDAHFLDASGKIVPGVKFVYGSRSDYDKTSCIVNILTTSNCDVSSIAKLLVDRQVKDSKTSIGNLLKNNHIENIDTVEIIGNVLVPGMFTSLKCNHVHFNSFTAKYLDRDCFKYLDCPTIDIPPSVVTLGESCFAYSKMTSIFIPATVTTLGDKCFEGCYRLSVNFEVDKSELDKSRSKFGNGKYAGYNSKWGKTEVAKITYNNTVALESLNEDDDFVTDDFGMPVFENNTYKVYRIETTEECNNLNTYLTNKGFDQDKKHGLIGGLKSDIDSWGYKRYFIENKKNIQDSKIYNNENSTIRYFVSADECKNTYIKEALANDEDLREAVLFSNAIDSLSNLKEILRDKNITKEIPLDDKRYYVDSFIDVPSYYTKKEDLLKVFLKYIDNGDYSAAFELADIPYPNYEDFTDSIKKSLSSEKGKKILIDNNIDENDAINAVDNFGELHDIIKQSAMQTLIDDMVDNVRNFISDRTSKNLSYHGGAPIDVNFGKNRAKIHILDLYKYKPEITKDNFEQIAYDYMDNQISNNINNTRIINSADSYYKDSILKNNIKGYSLNQKLFLNNLEDNIKYYYN